jgi:hypothetical protein
MKIFLYRLSISVLILFAFFLLTSIKAQAQYGSVYPMLDFNGQFWYCDGSSSGDAAWCRQGGGNPNNFDDWSLNFSLDVTQVLYSPTSSTSDHNVDHIIDAEFVFSGTLYNDADQNGDPSDPGWNYIFGPNQPSGGNTGPVDFSIKDLDGFTYLTGQFSNYVVTPEECTDFGPPIGVVCVPPRLNWDWSQNSLWSYEIDPAALAITNPSDDHYSPYIQQLGALLDSGQVINSDMQMQFDFSVGSADNQFVGDSEGSIVSGKIAVLPEPVSSMLFIAGSATLLVRRYFRKKNNQNS